ncbi:hypothetical protein WJ54_16075 [Burkholderia ubonensis]|nr:hypothetical protein WJ54_16075 [Burkholderia ubonensis]
MQPISVEVTDDGQVTLTQIINDLNVPDPIIELTREQAPLVAQWIIEAAAGGGLGEDSVNESIPVRFFDGQDADAENVQVYLNAAGMVIIKLDRESYIELSPVVAKLLRQQLTAAINESVVELNKPDSVV